LLYRSCSIRKVLSTGSGNCRQKAAAVGVMSMSDCCSTEIKQSPKKLACPINGIAYPEVTLQTIIHHIKTPWSWTGSAKAYYFCADPACHVAYFGEDGSIVPADALRQKIGIKDASQGALLCYCFNVTKLDFLSDASVKDFVVEQTKNGNCACDTRNPSGRCCLKDFPRVPKLTAIKL
jgi:hypothetical protein